LYVECLLLKEARYWSEQALNNSKNEEFLYLKFRLHAKARILKKCGFFVESLEELNGLETEIKN